MKLKMAQLHNKDRGVEQGKKEEVEAHFSVTNYFGVTIFTSFIVTLEKQ